MDLFSDAAMLNRHVSEDSVQSPRVIGPCMTIDTDNTKSMVQAKTIGRRVSMSQKDPG